MTEKSSDGAPGLDFPIATDLEMETDFPDRGRCVLLARAGDQHLNPNGVVHGAAVFAAVDTSMGGATMDVLEEGQYCASIEVHLRFLRMLGPGPFRVETEVLRAGRRVVQLESKVFDDSDELVAEGSGSFAVLGTPSG